MSLRKRQQEATRRAILDALGALIAEEGTMGFSVQDVARRAGVTHRTVYNHFPTREALNDAFATHVEDLLAAAMETPPDEGIGILELPDMIDRFFPILERYEAPLRAYVMLMVASRAPAGVATARSRRFETLLESQFGPLPPGQARAIVAGLRMFASTTGWHVLTELQGLSFEEARATSSWALRVLLDAISRGDVPHLESSDEPNHDH